jgi:hypothetical protein
VISVINTFDYPVWILFLGLKAPTTITTADLKDSRWATVHCHSRSAVLSAGLGGHGFRRARLELPRRDSVVQGTRAIIDDQRTLSFHLQGDYLAELVSELVKMSEELHIF